MKEGQFIWVRVPFAEGDGRSKTRPALILAVANSDGHKVYLCAGVYSAADKVRGAVEVILTAEDSVKVGLESYDKVVRFSRQHVHALLDTAVVSMVGCVSALPPCKQVEFVRAAKSIGF